MLTVGALETLPLQAGDFPKDNMFRPLFDCVWTLLQSERLIPAHDGSFASASEGKLARGAELRELITDSQLNKLNGAQSKWLSGEITQDRTPTVYRYLTNILKIDEIDPENLVRAAPNARGLRSAASQTGCRAAAPCRAAFWI
jgi:hypothetical protein